MRNLALSEGLWVGGGKAATATVALAVNAVLAHILSPDSLGAFFLAFSLATFAGVLGQAGLNQLIVRQVSALRAHDSHAYISHTVKISVGTAASTGLLTAIVMAVWLGEWASRALFDSPEMAELSLWIAGWTFLIVVQSLIAEALRGLDRAATATLFDSTRPLIPSLIALGVFCIFWAYEVRPMLSDIVACLIFSYLAGIATGLAVLVRSLPQRASGNFSAYSTPAEMLSESWPLMVNQIALTSLGYACLWIIGISGSKVEVALYGASLLFLQLVGFPLVVVNAWLSPKIALMYARHEQTQLEKVLRQAATFAALPSLAVLVFLIFFGAHFMSLVFGEAYRSAYPILLALSLGQVGNVLAGSCGAALAMTGCQASLMRITLFTGAGTVLLAAVLFGWLGALGVALAASFGLLTQNLLMLLTARSRLGIWTHIGRLSTG